MFRDYLESENLTLPPGYDDENQALLRILQCMKWDYKKTYDDIIKHNKW